MTELVMASHKYIKYISIKKKNKEIKKKGENNYLKK